MLGEKSFHVSNGTVRRRCSACFLLHYVHAAASRAELLPRASLPRRRPPPPEKAQDDLGVARQPPPFPRLLSREPCVACARRFHKQAEFNLPTMKRGSPHG